MASFKGNKLYVHGSGLKTGILITNLGTPDEPTKSSLKTYLKQFLSDERVIETPKAIWWPILNGIVLNTRPAFLVYLLQVFQLEPLVINCLYLYKHLDVLR